MKKYYLLKLLLEDYTFYSALAILANGYCLNNSVLKAGDILGLAEKHIIYQINCNKTKKVWTEADQTLIFKKNKII